MDTVFTRFRAAVQRRQTAPFLHVTEETARAYGIAAGDISYAVMLAQAEARAQAFRKAGYVAGQRVGLLLENRPEFIACWLALNSLGLSIVPINPDLRQAELEYLARDSGMVLAITIPARAADLSLATGVPVITADAPLPKAPAAKAVQSSDQDRECALLYTSGTTGQPKGCILSNRYFTFSGEWYAGLGGAVSLRPDAERMLTPLPLFHMNALACSLMAMVETGGCLISLDRFHPRSWWQVVRDSGATVVHYLGVMPSILMAAPPRDSDRSHSVRFGFGAGVDTKLHAPFEDRFGFPLIEAWAMTESGVAGCIIANEEPRHVGTACFGRASDAVELRVVDDAGRDCGPDQPGEMLVRRAGEAPLEGFFSGYLNKPGATAEVVQGGWLHTGDIVRRDAGGNLRFVDRKKNVIRRSGENISAVEVETILNRHPAIEASAAAALADEIRGEEVCALVVLAPGQQVEPAQIAGWALQQMAYYKVPGWIAFVQALPVSPTQKILRGQLKAQVAALAEQGAFTDLRAMKKRQVPAQ